jgi:hypothetical protein
VTWHKANIFHPPSYTSLLSGADAVVHSMGILLEADYKRIVSGQESPLAGLARLFGSTSRPGYHRNPLEKESSSSSEASEPATADPSKQEGSGGTLTYELMNRDSAILLARESAAQTVPAFIYVSASSAPPIIPSRYISTKRAAESTIASAFPRLRSVFVRPGFMYDASRSFTLPLAAATALGAAVNRGIFGGRLTPLMGAGGEKPLRADDVAEAIVEAVDDGQTRGVVDGPGIERLAVKAWRKGMV